MWTSLGAVTEPAGPRAASGRFWAVTLGAAVGLFLLGFLIGWFAKPVEEKTPLRHHEEMKAAFMAEMKTENIKHFLFNFTQRPHLAGTKENLYLAQQVQAEWKEFGLDSVQLVHYDVLLSYPDENQPNYVSVIDEHGNEVFNTSLSEPPPAGYEAVGDVVPPYSAFSAQGVPEALEQVAQRSYGCSIPGAAQGQIGWGPGQPGLVEGVPAHGKGIGPDDLHGAFQPKTFYDFMTVVRGPSKNYGELVYVNYGRTEDFFKLEREMGINCTGKIVIARYGKIFRGNKVKNAELSGAKGIILYSDPADYCAPGVDPYPNGWNLPGGGAQRGNVLNLNGAGDPLTPGYPAKEYTYRLDKASGVGLPKIPVHPIGYHDAESLLRNMGGSAPPHSSWKGNLNVSYNVGPGFTTNYSTRKVKMHIHSNNKVTRIYNVIGTIRGTVEPDRYVILGGHRDSWVFGGIDPQSGAAVVHEIVRSFGKLKKEGWRPRRTVIFASWDAEEFGLLGSTEWAEENAKLLQSRGVAYINADSSIEGNYTLRVDCTPLMYRLVYSVTKEIPSPDEGFEGKSLYESWYKKNPSTEYKEVPRINKLGSGNDFEVFFQRLGIASGRARYSKNWNVEKYSSYPVYHSVYETYEIVERFYDPSFKNHLTVAQVRGGLVFELANSVLLPFDCRDYASALSNYAHIIYNMSRNHEEELAIYNVSFDALFSAVKNFTEVADSFHDRLQQIDINNLLAVRSINDQLMFLERAFIDPLGLPGRPFYRHVIFAPSSHNKYAGESFPGIYDAMFDIKNKADQDEAWKEVKRQISIAAFTVQAAAGTLKEVA